MALLTWDACVEWNSAEIDERYIFYWKDYIWKKLTAFNIAFLKSLNFIVRNSWYPKYYRIWTHLWRLRFIQSVHQHYVWRDIAAGFVHVVVRQFFLLKEDWSRRKTIRQRSPRINFDTSAQWLQLLSGKFCDGAWDWIIQSAVTDASRCIIRDQ